MNKQTVIGRLCGLVTHVGSKVYQSDLEHDCFCETPERFASVHPEIIAFIENAVNVAIVARSKRQ